MTDLIYTQRANDHSALSNVDLLERAPSIFTGAPIASASDRYGHFKTSDAITMFKDYGFQPVQARQKQGKTSESHMHAEHLISFAKDTANPGTKDGRPEIILYNSSNTTSAFKLFAGYFRFICSNGIIAGDGINERVIHRRGSVEIVEDLLKSTIEKLPALMETIKNMKEKHVSEFKQLDFVDAAAALRWDSIDDYLDYSKDGQFYDRNITSFEMIAPRRYYDDDNTAWGIFNRVQESLLRGGVNVFCTSEKNMKGKYRKARAIKSVSETVKLNRKLWDLAPMLDMAA